MISQWSFLNMDQRMDRMHRAQYILHTYTYNDDFKKGQLFNNNQHLQLELRRWHEVGVECWPLIVVCAPMDLLQNTYKTASFQNEAVRAQVALWFSYEVKFI